MFCLKRMSGGRAHCTAVALAVLVLLQAGWSNAESCADSSNPESCGTGGIDGSNTVFESLSVGRVLLASGLSLNFYDKTCPNYRTIIQAAITQAIQANPLQPAGLTRLMFHDCFIQGCDASLLLTGSNSEQNATPNLSLRAASLALINTIKALLEAACPNTVSCADILSLCAAESIRQSKGPTIKMPLGRRDGTNPASISTVNSGLPSPFNNVSQNMPIFTNLGLGYIDYVALSGAHTLGQAHCSSFIGRLRPKLDPDLDVTLGNSLLQLCSASESGIVSQQNVHSLDSTSSLFDNSYFKQALTGDVLLLSDSSMELDGHTSGFLRQFARSTRKFDAQFVRSFLKMSQLGVLTGSNGVIRTTCTAP